MARLPLNLPLGGLLTWGVELGKNAEADFVCSPPASAQKLALGPAREAPQSQTPVPQALTMPEHCARAPSFQVTGYPGAWEVHCAQLGATSSRNRAPFRPI